MPKCYLLTLVGGSSLDRYSNNVTLFNLVEQLNFPSDRRPPPGAVIPLEVHAYFQLDSVELNQRFEVRFSLVAPTGLETVTDTFSPLSDPHRGVAGTAGRGRLPAARRHAAQRERALAAAGRELAGHRRGNGSASGRDALMH
jgi:hypothetical protein